MSWLEKILPPKIRKTDTAAHHQIPEGLWLKYPSCSTVLYKTDLEQNQCAVSYCFPIVCKIHKHDGVFRNETDEHDNPQDGEDIQCLVR